MNRLLFSASEMESRYPNLIRACQWTGHLTASEAHLVLWAVKNNIADPLGSKRVALFGSPKHLISQAVRTRNL